MKTLFNAVWLTLTVSWSGLVFANGELPFGIEGWETKKSGLAGNGLAFDECLGGDTATEVCYLETAQSTSGNASTYRFTFGTNGGLKSITRIVTPSSVVRGAGIRNAYKSLKTEMSDTLGLPVELKDTSGDGSIANPSVVQDWYSMWSDDRSTVWLKVATRVVYFEGSMGYRVTPVLHISYRESQYATDLASAQANQGSFMSVGQ